MYGSDTFLMIVMYGSDTYSYDNDMEASLSKVWWRAYECILDRLVCFHLMRILYDRGLGHGGLMCFMLKYLCILLCISTQHWFTNRITTIQFWVSPLLWFSPGLWPKSWCLYFTCFSSRFPYSSTIFLMLMLMLYVYNCLWWFGVNVMWKCFENF